jgi:hypothetical protein
VFLDALAINFLVFTFFLDSLASSGLVLPIATVVLVNLVAVASERKLLCFCSFFGRIDRYSGITAILLHRGAE